MLLSHRERFQQWILKVLENLRDSSMVIVSHRVVHSGACNLFFSLHWCQLCTKGYYHYTGRKNVKHFIIFCQPLWEPALSGCFGGGIYWGHGINTGPTPLIRELGCIHCTLSGVREKKGGRGGGGWGHDQVTMTMSAVSWMWCSQTLVPDQLSPSCSEQANEFLVHE